MEGIRKIGNDLTRKDFEEYAKLSPIEKIERKKILTTDEDLRDAYEKQINAIKAEQADRESALEGEAEKAALARERALEKGRVKRTFVLIANPETSHRFWIFLCFNA